MGKPTNKQLTNSKFGPWGWSMILYAFLLYYFWAGLSVDALNVYPEAFAALHGWDPNVLLGFATPAGIIGVLGGIWIFFKEPYEAVLGNTIVALLMTTVGVNSIAEAVVGVIAAMAVHTVLKHRNLS